MRDGFSLDRLRRWPDVEAPELVAVDATDRLVLDTAAERLDSSAPGDVAILGDRHGGMSLGAWGLHGATEIRVHQDALLGERAILANAHAAGAFADIRATPLDAGLVGGARTVLMQLPRSLAELERWASIVARHAHRDVVLIAGGRVKHMSPTMNDVLRRFFDRVDVGHARQKSRVLIASGPRSDAAEVAPERTTIRADVLPGGSLEVVAHGGVFAGAALDIGTRALLAHLPSLPTGHDVIDLGCGTGVIAASIALTSPAARVVGIDQSAAAVESTLATAAANGQSDRVGAEREDGLTERADTSADLILCNPPFHSGATVTDALAGRMLADARRVLRPGGELWTVFNSHLRYRPLLERLVGPTEEMSRTSKFTVTRSRRG